MMTIVEEKEEGERKDPNPGMTPLRLLQEDQGHALAIGQNHMMMMIDHLLRDQDLMMTPMEMMMMATSINPLIMEEIEVPAVALNLLVHQDPV